MIEMLINKPIRLSLPGSQPFIFLFILYCLLLLAVTADWLPLFIVVLGGLRAVGGPDEQSRPPLS